MGVKAKEYSPIIRCKDTFYVKSKNGIGQPYDFEFVTFLRDILSLGQDVDEASFSWHKTVPCAEWIEKDQGVFRINDTQELSTRWCNFKGLDYVSWDHLYNSVIADFINRNIFKQIFSGDFVFQVFCIKQLLK